MFTALQHSTSNVHHTLALVYAICTHAPQLSGNYRMHLKCTTGPINVLVLNQDEGVATMVPVPKCPRTSAEHTHAQQPQTEDEAMESSEINDEHSVEKTTEVVASRTQPGEASPVGVEGSVGQSLKTQSGQNSQSDGEPEQTLSGKEETGRSEKNEATSESPMEVCTPVSHESPNKGSSTPQRSDSLAAIVERLHKGNEEKSQDKEDQGDGKSRIQLCRHVPSASFYSHSPQQPS